MFFKDRVEAGRKLAGFFDHLNGRNAVVYALPRGGVVVGAEISKTIHAPLDLIIVRKIGHPNQPEFAIGAVTEDGHSILNKEILDVPEDYIHREANKQRLEAKKRREIYLGKRLPISCKGKLAILADDGIATGLTMKTAINELKLHYLPSKIIVAVPVAPREEVNELEKMGVEVLSIITTKEFLGPIGSYYQDFSPVENQDVVSILRETERFNHFSVPSI